MSDGTKSKDELSADRAGAGDVSGLMPPRASILPGVVGAVAAISGFTVALISGLFSGNPALLVLGRGVVAMLGCYVVGLLVGLVLQRVSAQQLAAYRREHPMPEATDEVHAALSAGAGEAAGDEEILVV